MEARARTDDTEHVRGRIADVIQPCLGSDESIGYYRVKSRLAHPGLGLRCIDPSRLPLVQTWLE